MKADIHSMKEFLEKQEMKCVLAPRSKEIPFDQLFLPMGVDEKGRDLLLQIKVIEEDLSDSYKLYNVNKPASKYHLIQFFLGLPFAAKSECVGEVARLILLLNKSFGLPGFEFSEVDRIIYFRSVLMTTGVLDELVLIAAIGNLMTYVDTFAETLESVAEGKMTLADVVTLFKEEHGKI